MIMCQCASKPSDLETHAEDLRRDLHKMQMGEGYKVVSLYCSLVALLHMYVIKLTCTIVLPLT